MGMIEARSERNVRIDLNRHTCNASSRRVDNMNGSDMVWKELKLMKVVMMRCWMESPYNAATTSDTLALLRRISPVSLFPHGPQRLLDKLGFVKHNSQWCRPDIYNLINRQCTK